jgi:hypothetical protein
MLSVVPAPTMQVVGSPVLAATSGVTAATGDPGATQQGGSRWLKGCSHIHQVMEASGNTSSG